MGNKDPRFDAYIAKAAPFARPILKHLRKIVHAGCPGVEETLKWGHPAFMYKGMLCGFAAFKQHATFGFWKHALIAGDGKGAFKASAEAMGQFGRLTTLSDLPGDRVLHRLVKQAVALNDQGVKVPKPPRPTGDRKLTVPAYFMTALRGSARALKTFKSLSYNHQKEYVEWVVEAKTEATRERRLETAIEWMAQGRELNWKYVRK